MATNNIFISYRRDDSAGSSGRIYDRLTTIFAPEQIFKDVDSIPIGSNFKKAMEDSVESCQVVLAVIGKDYTRLKDKEGVPRIMKKTDFVNIELAHAFRAGKTIIPVLVDNARMPAASELPENLQELPFLNAIEIRNTNFKGDVAKLARALDNILNQGRPQAFADDGTSTNKKKKHRYLSRIIFLWIGCIVTCIGCVLYFEENGIGRKNIDTFLLTFLSIVALIFLSILVALRGKFSLLEKILLWLGFIIATVLLFIAFSNMG
jgi:hypothetical protein